MPTISRFYGIVVTLYFGNHPPPHIHVEYSGHEGRIAFLTGDVMTGDVPGRVVRMVDMEPMLDGPVFGPLRDPEQFRAVTVDAELRTISWPGGADLDPDVIYAPALRTQPGGARITTPTVAA